MEEIKYRLINAYDELVRGSVKEMMEQTDMCRCEKCYLDVCAIVFNRRYTHFVTSGEGEALAKIPDMNHGNRVEMMVMIMDAIKTVKSFPKH